MIKPNDSIPHKKSPYEDLTGLHTAIIIFADAICG